MKIQQDRMNLWKLHSICPILMISAFLFIENILGIQHKSENMMLFFPLLFNVFFLVVLRQSKEEVDYNPI